MPCLTFIESELLLLKEQILNKELQVWGYSLTQLFGFYRDI